MRKWIIIAAAVIVVLVIVGFMRRGGGDAAQARYEFAEVTRGDLENVITATGALSAVGTVEVGTQVSGTIAQVLADYNETVHRGRVLAVLDTTMHAASVRDARANRMKVEAQYEQALRDHGRVLELFEQGLVSDAEIEESRTSMKSAEAALLAAEASLDRQVANLSYAVIRSPIDGTVIMRNVERGQTVAASFSTPTLFTIAEDLSQMEIRAYVDESDIGQIEEGLRARFTVEAYIDEEFTGVVRQVWLQPQTISNVVNYTVVVDAKNSRGLLLPGMTATVDFLLDDLTNVLLVPNSALSIHPDDAMIEEIRATMRRRTEADSSSAQEQRAARPGDGRPQAGGEGSVVSGPSGGRPTGGMPGGGMPGGGLG
ncbi:efflux RND transporter periplasmic adaptor subunit, partial [bacterium]|nr:efflux RND transporter periplasmic adaptor subunit [bacterium]